MTETTNPWGGSEPGHQAGRRDVQDWAASQPENFFDTDPHFQRVLARHQREDTDPTLLEDLHTLGHTASQIIDPQVRINNENANLPRLDRYTAHGARVERIAHHPSYHEAGRHIYGSGVMSCLAEGPNLLGALARFYVSSYNGEAGHNCPLACTAGVIRVLQELGSEELKDRFLPHFLDRDYDNHYEGAQFLTEIQGGSDVGANATRAEVQEDGTWRIFGEKWFCSNIDADVFLMTARLPDTTGTRGLGLFLVPRMLESGEVNEFYVRRLKDKLGTRSMASGECDFRGALAYHMGEVGDGFKNMMRHVINVSRLYNAVGCCGVARRAFIDAQRYAAHRRAFGQPIGNYPLVQETLADMRAEIETLTTGTFALVALQDDIDRGDGTDIDAGFMRLAINLNKMLTAKSCRWAIVQGIEIFGGNGAIETFSVLPRLLRDSIVYENWEGTHNTLLMQCMRDMARYKVHEPFFAKLLSIAGATGLANTLAPEIEKVGAKVAELGTMNPGAATLAIRPLADQMTYLMHATLAAQTLEADHELTTASLQHFVERNITQPTYDDAFLSRIALLSGGI